MKRDCLRLFLLLLVAVLLVGIVGSAAAEKRVTRVQTGEKGASLRDAPAGEKIGSIHQFTNLVVDDQRSGWFHVYHNGEYGWVSSTVVTVTRIEDTNPSCLVLVPGQASWEPYDMGIPYIGDTVFGENKMNMVIFWVQTQLKATSVWYQGYQWDVTGKLGDHTMSEIRSFMSACGYCWHTGVVDQQVIDALADYLGDRIQPVMIGGFYDSMSILLTGDSYGTMQPVISNLRDMVPHVKNGARWVQSVLKGIGYYSGTVDGMYGERTDAAVRRFQNDYGFQERDYVTLGVARSMLEQYYYRGLNLGLLPQGWRGAR